jgi:hypothetical protein
METEKQTASIFFKQRKTISKKAGKNRPKSKRTRGRGGRGRAENGASLLGRMRASRRKKRGREGSRRAQNSPKTRSVSRKKRLQKISATFQKSVNLHYDTII